MIVCYLQLRLVIIWITVSFKESAMGRNVDAQSKMDSDYVKSVYK